MGLTPADVHNVAFNKPPLGRRGYNEDEVDAFLDRVEAEMSELVAERDSLREQLASAGKGASTAPFAPPVLTPAVRSTADDGALKAITAERDDLKSELSAVKAQLDDMKSNVGSDSGQTASLRKQHEALIAERDILAAKLKQTEADLQQARAALKEAEERAAKPVEQDPTAPATRLMAMAQEVAERLQSDAKADAERVVHDATKQADQLLSKAREQASSTENETNRRRIDLEAKIDQLKAFEREYRSHLRNYLTHQLGALEEEKQLAGKK